jgi:hypothetical protein
VIAGFVTFCPPGVTVVPFGFVVVLDGLVVSGPEGFVVAAPQGFTVAEPFELPAADPFKLMFEDPQAARTRASAR